MQDDEPRRLPTTIGGLFGVAAALYGRRAGLYLGLAAAAFAVQFAGDVLLPHTVGSAIAFNVVADAFVAAAVAIGVAHDLAGEPPRDSLLLSAASHRWGAVAICQSVYALMQLLLQPGVFGAPQDTGYGLFAVPIVLLWGAAALGPVAAAIDPLGNRWWFAFLAVGKALSLALPVWNLLRLLVFAVVLVVPAVVGQWWLMPQLLAHHVPEADFWSGVPLDALTEGPLQALATVFYLDFARRAQRLPRK